MAPLYPGSGAEWSTLIVIRLNFPQDPHHQIKIMASTCLKYDVCLVVAHFAAECAHPVFFIHENNEEDCTLEVYNKFIEWKKKSSEIFIHVICCEFDWEKNIIVKVIIFFQLIKIIICDQQQKKSEIFPWNYGTRYPGSSWKY